MEPPCDLTLKLRRSPIQIVLSKIPYLPRNPRLQPLGNNSLQREVLKRLLRTEAYPRQDGARLEQQFTVMNSNTEQNGYLDTPEAARRSS